VKAARNTSVGFFLSSKTIRRKRRFG